MSLINATLLMCAQKWGVISLYEAYKPKWLPTCYFCFGFWIACIETICIDFNHIYIIPFACTSLTYFIFKNIA